MTQVDERGEGAGAARRAMPLGHARILIGVVLFAAIAGLAAALLPGTQEEPSSPGPELADVQSALRAALGEDAAGVQVALSDRTVVLQGAVPSEDLRRRAVQSVLALDAVVEVDDELRVSPR